MKNPWAKQKRRYRMPKYLSKYRFDSDIAIQLIDEESISDSCKLKPRSRLSFLERFKRFF